MLTENDIAWSEDNRYSIWTTGHDLLHSGRRPPIGVGRLEVDELPREMAHIRICSQCGKHFDSVRCECERKVDHAS